MVGDLASRLLNGGVLAIIGLSGSGPLFFGAMLRYRLGPQFPNWEKASYAMGVGILGAVGFFIAVVRALGGGE